MIETSRASRREKLKVYVRTGYWLYEPSMKEVLVKLHECLRDTPVAGAEGVVKFGE